MRKGRNLELVIKKINNFLFPGATITSPEFVTDIDTGTSREVDIGIRFSTEQGSVFIAIECRDRGAVQDIQWIEQLISKKRSVQADVLIAVTSSDFTEPAKVKAFKNGVDIRNLEAFSGNDLLVWMNETYLELHSLDAKMLASAEVQPAENIQELAIRINGNTSYYNEISKETIDSDTFLRELSQIIYEESFPEEIQSRIPSHGDEVQFYMTMNLNYYHFIVPSNLYLLTPSRKVKIERIGLNLVIKKYIRRYPLSSISKYKGTAIGNPIAELFEYARSENKPCQLISGGKKDESALYLDFSQIDLEGRMFSSLFLKCKEAVTMSQVRIKF
ncbi:MAG: restriction endonuclease [Lyngbya sp. HA4199-MV5]|jgi:hypothetical protein|nr:restriction endonuclease [Lyngbya sp. HA4199-MV5]